MLKRLFWTLTLAAAAAMATAQGDFLHRPSPFAGRTLLTLSLFEEVRTELKTTPDENTKVDALVEKVQTEMQDAFQSGNGDFEAIRVSIEKVNKKYDDETLKVLTADQGTRLKQLFIQFNGATAISNEGVAKELALTDDQKAKVKAAQDDNSKKMRDAFGGGGGGDPQEAMAKIQSELKAALSALLTDDQKTKFKTMEGTKFEFKKTTP